MASPEIFGGYVRKITALALDLLFPATRADELLAQTDKKMLGGLKLRGTVPGHKDIISLFPYGHPAIRNLIWELKYRGNPHAVKLCAEALYDALVEKISTRGGKKDEPLPLLIPLPLSKKRQRERGFNQTELVAQKMSEMDQGLHFTMCNNVLYKIKDTKSQTTIKDKKKRRENILGCFSVKDREAVAGKTTVLIDDVLTTGSTIHEARRVLLEAGARRVIALTVAH